MRETGGEALTAVGAIAESEIGIAVALGGVAAIVAVFLSLTLAQLHNMDVP